MGELSVKLDDSIERLKEAKAGTEDALEAQKELDEMRLMVDALLPSVESNLKLVEKVAASASASIKEANAAREKAEKLELKAKKDKVRLEGALNAVKNALKIG